MSRMCISASQFSLIVRRRQDDDYLTAEILSPNGRVLCTLWPDSLLAAERVARDNGYQLVVDDLDQTSLRR